MTEFQISLPATSANLGPAFDAAALALDLSLRLRARKSREFSIKATGRDADICGRVENHLILKTYEDVLSAEGRAAPRLALTIHNEFPIGKGFGSSAAARLAGIALAVHFGRLRWNSARIIGEASRREHHPDNAAACWMGGVTVARMCGETEAQVARLCPKENGSSCSPFRKRVLRLKGRGRCFPLNILGPIRSPTSRILSCF